MDELLSNQAIIAVSVVTIGVFVLLRLIFDFLRHQAAKKEREDGAATTLLKQQSEMRMNKLLEDIREELRGLRIDLRSRS